MMMLLPVAEAAKRIRNVESFILWETEKHYALVGLEDIQVARKTENGAHLLFSVPREQWEDFREFLSGISDEEKTPWDIFDE